MKDRIETWVVAIAIVLLVLWLLSQHSGGGGAPDGCLPGVSC